MRKYIIWLILAVLAISPASRAEIYVGNAGYPGDATTQGLNRLYKDVLSYKPQVMVIMFGTNDFGNASCNLTPEKFEKNLTLLVEKSRQAGVRDFVLMTPPPVVEEILLKRSQKLPSLLPPGKSPNQYLQSFREAVKRVSVQQKTAFLDVYGLIESNGGATKEASCLLRNPANSRSDDGTHLTAKGYQVLAEALYPIVQPMLKDGEILICLGDSITFGAHMAGCGTASGDTYPSKLWKLLNPQGTRASTVPSETWKKGNMIRNPGMETPDENGRMPLGWVFWAKNKDICRYMEGKDAHEGTRYLRVTSDPKASGANSEAVARHDVVMVNGGKTYAFSAYVRGKGKLEFVVGIYDVAKWITIKSVELTDQWQKLEGEVAVPHGYSRSCLIFKVRGTVDIDDAWYALKEETPKAAAQPAAPATAQPAASADAKPSRPLLSLHSDKRLTAPTVSMNFARPEEGAAVKNVVSKDGVKFTNRGVSRGLWAIRMKKIAFNPADYSKVKGLTFDPEMDHGAAGKNNDCESDDDLIIDASEVLKLGGTASVAEKGNCLIYTFKGMRVDKEQGALDVTIEVKPGEDGGVEFNGSFSNRSKEYTVFYFVYPQVEGLGGIHGKPEDDYLANPIYLGRLIHNPASGKLYKTNLIFRGNNSGHSMHFDALYNRGDGLFFHVKDPVQYAKRWLMRSELPTGFLWSVCHVPDNMRCAAPQNWRVPYPIEISGYKGDWYDAACLYRKWALKQYWCEQGTLVNRVATGDVPQWFLDVTAWNQEAVECIVKSRKMQIDAYFKEFSDHRNGMWMCWWGDGNKSYDFPNPDRFPLTEMDKEAIRSLKARNIPISAYIQTTAWAMDKPIFKNTPNAEQCLVRNYYGQILAWGTSGNPGQAAIAYPGEPWRKVLVAVTNEMARCGFDSAYMDSGNHGGFYLNFNPVHAKHTGGGNDYVMDNQKLLKEVRSEGRKINPGFCTTAESFWEGNLNCLDAVLTCNSPSFFLEGDRVTAIPLAPVVYHDYALCYSTHYSKNDILGKQEGYVCKTAQELVWGIKLGWELTNTFYLYENPNMLRLLAHDRFRAYDAGMRYLVYGRMLRPPVVTPNGSHIIPWAVSWSYHSYDVMQPDVVSSAWEGPEGTLALVFYNTSTMPCEVDVPLTDPEYKAASRTFSALYPTTKKFRVEKDNLHITLPSRQAVIIEGK